MPVSIRFGPIMSRWVGSVRQSDIHHINLGWMREDDTITFTTILGEGVIDRTSVVDKYMTNYFWSTRMMMIQDKGIL